MKRILMMLALTALLVVALSMSAVSAFAAHPPNVGNFAGGSDNFKHNSNACQGSTGKAPKCVGSENSYH
jgi:hypothetical protein